MPKIHMMEYNISMICAKGSMDGYSTEISEQLHINCAKEGYHTSNKKNYTEQMIKYLHCHETIHTFNAFLDWTAALPEDSKGSDTDNTSNLDMELNIEDIPTMDVSADVHAPPPVACSQGTVVIIAKQPQFCYNFILIFNMIDCQNIFIGVYAVCGFN